MRTLIKKSGLHPVMTAILFLTVHNGDALGDTPDVPATTSPAGAQAPSDDATAGGMDDSIVVVMFRKGDVEAIPFDQVPHGLRTVALYVFGLVNVRHAIGAGEAHSAQHSEVEPARRDVRKSCGICGTTGYCVTGGCVFTHCGWLCDKAW